MGSVNSKVIDLKEYLKSHSALNHDELDRHIADQRISLNELDANVLDLLIEPHKLKDALLFKQDAVEIERNLVYVSSYLEKIIAEAKTTEVKTAKQDQLSQCEKLISKMDRVKKNLADDMAQCRYTEAKEALDPIKIGGSVIGTPVALATLTKTFFSAKPIVIAAAGGAGAVVGVGLAFHRQGWNLCKRMAKAIAQSPQKLKSARGSIIATTLTASMIVRSAKPINSNYPERSSIRPRATITAQL